MELKTMIMQILRSLHLELLLDFEKTFCKPFKSVINVHTPANLALLQELNAALAMFAKPVRNMICCHLGEICSN